MIGRRRRERHERELAELDAYEDAKAALVRSESSADVTGVTRTLADGRFHHACVLAAQAGDARPERRPPCFFDPAHGPATRDAEWAPAGRVPREIPVCFRDAERLAAGHGPSAGLSTRWGRSCRSPSRGATREPGPTAG